MSIPNRPTVQARDKQFIAGITKRLSNVPNLAIAGATYTPAQLIQLFQSQVDNADAVATAKARYGDAMKAFRDQRKQLTPVVSGFVTQVRNIFGDASEPLSDFGLSPKKTAKLTLEKKTAAVTQGKATRKARGTVGPKKKKAIKGTVPQTPASTTAAPKTTP